MAEVYRSLRLHGDTECTGDRLPGVADRRPELPLTDCDKAGAIELGIETAKDARRADAACRIDDQLDDAHAVQVFSFGNRSIGFVDAHQQLRCFATASDAANWSGRTAGR